jgi:hypothetical protein
MLTDLDQSIDEFLRGVGLADDGRVLEDIVPNPDHPDLVAVVDNAENVAISGETK